MTDSIPSAHYRRLVGLSDPDAQTEMSAAEYRQRFGQTANDLLRGLDAEKPARAHPELDWRRQVAKAAEIAGYKVYWTWQSEHSPAGMPDLILCRPPRLIFAELKAENGRLSTPQREWLEYLSEVPGVIAEVWRPSDIDHVLEVLQAA